MIIHHQGREHDGYHGQQLDQDVDGRSGGILERIAYRIAYNRRFVGIASLTAVLAALDVFLGIVPGAA